MTKVLYGVFINGNTLPIALFAHAKIAMIYIAQYEKITPMFKGKLFIKHWIIKGDN